MYEVRYEYRSDRFWTARFPIRQDADEFWVLRTEMYPHLRVESPKQVIYPVRLVDVKI
jgi:hypothetical protein